MGYISPKASSYSSSEIVSYSSPKAKSYSSPKTASYSSTSKSSNVKNSLNNLKNLLNRYIELTGDIQQTVIKLEELEQQKDKLEKQIVNDPNYGMFADIFHAIDNPSKRRK